jgi:hypothetical protein
MATIRRKIGHWCHWPKTLCNYSTATVDFTRFFDPLMGLTENSSFRPIFHLPVY